MSIEVWRDIEGYEWFYQVSNFGRVRSLGRKDSIDHFRHGKFLKSSPDRKGYRYIELCKCGQRRKYKVHRLVAQAFIPNPHNLPEVNHIDHDVANNRVENLEWCTTEYNLLHRRRIGRACKKQIHCV